MYSVAISGVQAYTHSGRTHSSTHILFLTFLPMTPQSRTTRKGSLHKSRLVTFASV
jgi:hypothetical protein